METEQVKESLFGETIYTYTSDQAVEDGILMKNPRADTYDKHISKLENLANKLEKEK